MEQLTDNNNQFNTTTADHCKEEYREPVGTLSGEETELPFDIQIISCHDHYQWYENSVYEKFEVIAINEAEQTYTVVAYDLYGRKCLEEVDICDCKILPA